MEYTKKFWSEDGRYVKPDNEEYVGYVGIHNGQAYDFYNSVPLKPAKLTYLTALHKASKDFNRNLNENLKLPFSREDVTLGPNDFLYSSTLSDIISKLQKNNEYIYQNCTISDGHLEIASDKLAAPNSALTNAYIADANKKITYEIKNKDGSWSSTASANIATTLGRKLERESSASAKEWAAIHSNGIIQASYSIDRISEKYNSPSNFQTIQSKFISATYTSNTTKNIHSAEIRPFEELNSITKQIYEDTFADTAKNIFLKIKSFSFITEGNNPVSFDYVKATYNTDANGNSINKDVWLTMKDEDNGDGNTCWYLSQELMAIPGTNYYLNTLYFKQRNGSNGAFVYSIPLDLLYSFTIGIGSTIKSFNYVANAFSIDYTIANSNNDIEDYAKIRDIIAYRNYQYRWTDGTTMRLAPVNITYGSLKNTREWINGGNLSSLVFSGSTELDNTFVPADDMTAKDVYINTKNSLINYDAYPNIALDGIAYKLGEMVDNPYYSPNHYPLMTFIYKDGKIQRGYKSAETIAKELEWGKKNSTSSGYTMQEKLFADIPIIRKIVSIDNDKEKEIAYNLAEINACELVYYNSYYYGIIAFNNKIVIIKDINNHLDVIYNIAEAIKDGRAVELDAVKYGNTNFKFLNIKSLRIYDDYLYVVDSKLNAVFQYSIVDTLENGAEPLLINYLEGDGSAKDKLYFKNPRSIAISSNRVYVADSGNKCIKVYTKNLNYVKTLKNIKYASYNIHAININPQSLYLFNDTKVEKDSLWIISEMGNKLYLSIYSEEKLVYHGKIENIQLEQDQQLWIDEVRNLVFSESNSSHYYIATSRHIYKLYTSRPLTPIGSFEYCKEEKDTNNIRNPFDHRCFALTLNEKENGDKIFSIFLHYDYEKLLSHLGDDKFNSLSTSEKINSLASHFVTDKKDVVSIFFTPRDDFFSTLAEKDLYYKDTDTIVQDNDYVNAFTFNKMIYPLAYNLYSLKNGILGTLKTIASGDTNITGEDIEVDLYYYNLNFDNFNNLLMHDNESLSISINRIFESIVDMQTKIINHMQSKHMSSSAQFIYKPKLI